MSWKKIWEKKGSNLTSDLKWLDGFENVKQSPKLLAKNIIKQLDIKKTDKVLDVGCGAGMISQHLECDYVGVDYSKPLVKKHYFILHHSVLVAEANNLPFKDKSFDKVMAYSVFHYFPNKKIR